MSLLPLLFSAWWAELEHPHRLLDQNFGLGLYPEQLLFPSATDRFSPLRTKSALDFYFRPMLEFMRSDLSTSGTSTITADKDTFRVILDVQQFKPEEVTVKLVDRFVVVEAKHEEKRDEHGLISRQFVRKYLLPDQVDADQLTSNISSDGILTITAPAKAMEEKRNERTIKIELTGKPAAVLPTTLPTGTSTTTTTATEKPITVEQTETREETTTETAQEKPEK